MSASVIQSKDSVTGIEEIRPGVFRQTAKYRGKSVHFFMELLTQENSPNWGLYKRITSIICSEGGSLYLLAKRESENQYPPHSQIASHTGFSEEDHLGFQAKLRSAIDRTKGKIIDLIYHTCLGSDFMDTHEKNNTRFIVYASTDSEFKIPAYTGSIDTSLKNWIQSYSTLLICAGSNFEYNETEFQTRGIFRNPYDVITNEHPGLSMLLHGFSGVFAKKQFPSKQHLFISPIASMFNIIQKHFHSDEAFIREKDENRPLAEVKCSLKTIGDVARVLIKIEALVRVFNLYQT